MAIITAKPVKKFIHIDEVKHSNGTVTAFRDIQTGGIYCLSWGYDGDFCFANINLDEQPLYQRGTPEESVEAAVVVGQEEVHFFESVKEFARWLGDVS